MCVPNNHAFCWLYLCFRRSLLSYAACQGIRGPNSPPQRGRHTANVEYTEHECNATYSMTSLTDWSRQCQHAGQNNESVWPTSWESRWESDFYIMLIRECYMSLGPLLMFKATGNAGISVSPTSSGATKCLENVCSNQWWKHLMPSMGNIDVI